MSASSQAVPASSSGVGERLRREREQAGLSLAQVAARLHMQLRVVEALEAEDWNRLGARVFVRGQLRSYLRLLKLPESLADDTVADSNLVQAPELTPRTYTPPMQRMLDKAMGRAVYVVITALIAVPVWVATRTHVGAPEQVTASLGLADEAGPAASTPRPAGPTPVTASMAGLPKRATASVPTAAPAVSGDAAGLSLRFNGDSWIEISGRDGRQIEQALVRAGQQRQLDVTQVGSIVLGNAGAVDVLRGADVQDLSGFQRANVARFTVSSDGVLAPLSE